MQLKMFYKIDNRAQCYKTFYSRKFTNFSIIYLAYLIKVSLKCSTRG
jgi:hypothetical protein